MNHLPALQRFLYCYAVLISDNLRQFRESDPQPLAARGLGLSSIMLTTAIKKISSEKVIGVYYFSSTFALIILSV